MNKLSLKYLFVIIAFIIYIYSVNLKFFPISLKQFFAVLGVFVFFFNSKCFRKTKIYISLLGICLIINFWGIITCFINNSSEYIYPMNYFVSPVSAFFASVFIFKVSSTYLRSIDDLFKIILYTVFIESIITVLIFAIPPLYDFCDSIGLLLLDEEIKENPFSRFSRFNGIGEAVYFGVLPSCSLGVMSGLYLQLKNKGTSKYLVFAAIISLVSFFVTRYSAVVVVVCVGVFLKYLLKNGGRKFFNYFIGMLALFSFLIIVAINLLPEEILRWAVGAFESDSQHNSTNIVIDWLLNTKIDFNTFIIGDARYTNPGGGYYGGVDIGLYRQIFYGGIIGFLLIVYFHRKILIYIKKLIPSDPFIRCFTSGLFLSYLVSLLKGDLSMLDLYLLVLVNITFLISEKGRNEIARIK